MYRTPNNWGELTVCARMNENIKDRKNECRKNCTVALLGYKGNVRKNTRDIVVSFFLSNYTVGRKNIRLLENGECLKEYKKGEFIGKTAW